MKSLLLVICMMTGAAALGQKPVPVDSVSSYLGEYVTVCDKVFGVKELEKVNFLNIGAAYPKAPLTVVIFLDAKKKFKTKLSDYEGKKVCITGNIVLYQGKTYQIKVEEESQIRIVNEGF